MIIIITKHTKLLLSYLPRRSPKLICSNLRVMNKVMNIILTVKNYRAELFKNIIRE